jgi:hypothetical protein
MTCACVHLPTCGNIVSLLPSLVQSKMAGVYMGFLWPVQSAACYGEGDSVEHLEGGLLCAMQLLPLGQVGPVGMSFW